MITTKNYQSQMPLIREIALERNGIPPKYVTNLYITFNMMPYSQAVTDLPTQKYLCELCLWVKFWRLAKTRKKLVEIIAM